MGWRIISAGTVRNGHVSRKCTCWHCEDINCFFHLPSIPDPVCHLLRAEKLRRSYPTPCSHGDGQSSALGATQPQGDAMRPLSRLTDYLCQLAMLLSLHWPRAGSQKKPRGDEPFLRQSEPSKSSVTLLLLLYSSWSYLKVPNNTSLHSYTFNENWK